MWLRYQGRCAIETGTHIGDPHLGAVQHPATINFFGRRFHTDNIGASRVFRHGQRTDFLAREETR